MWKISEFSQLKAFYTLLEPLRKVSPEVKLEGSAGVYLLQVGSRFYVGQTRNLRARLDWHFNSFIGENTSGGGVSPKYWAVMKKAREEGRLFKVFLLEHGDQCKNTDMRCGLERMWILLFWKLVSSENMMNVIYVPTTVRPRKEISRNTRLERSARMSAIVRSLHQNPEYKARAKEQARINYASVDEDRRKRLNAKISKRSRDLFKSPSYRANKAEHTRQQWKKDSTLLEANRERLSKLRCTGWKPTPAVVVRVVLPDESKYVLLQKDLVTLLKLGGRLGGPLKFFKVNPLVSDWTVEVVGAISGKLRLKKEEDFAEAIQEFKKNKFVSWLVRAKEKHEKLWTFTPLVAETTDGEFRFLTRNQFIDARRNGKKPHVVRTYPSLYSYLSDSQITAWNPS